MEHRSYQHLVFVITSLIAIGTLSSISAAPAPAEVWQMPGSRAPTTTTTTEIPTDAPYGAPEFICHMSGCGRNLRTRERLKDHLVRFHHADPVAINDIPGLYQRGYFIYRCTKCGQTFESRRRFETHFHKVPHVATCPLT